MQKWWSKDIRTQIYEFDIITNTVKIHENSCDEFLEQEKLSVEVAYTGSWRICEVWNYKKRV